jgi:aminoglycoside phosphotransferase (APT) family kinase protein
MRDGDDDRGASRLYGVLDKLCGELVDGGRLQTIEALTGGLSSHMTAFRVDAPDGIHAFVLRLYGDEAIQRDPRVAAREFAVLSALRTARTRVPAPIWMDVEGRTFDRPALVMTLLPGSVLGRPQGVDLWVDQFAQALAGIHAHQLTTAESNAIRGPESVVPQPGSQPAEHKLRHVAASRIWTILRDRQPASTRSKAVLLHGDFWLGNALWSAESLSGVVDWEMPLIGPREFDVGYCHMDLTLSFGRTIADRFVQSYERSAGDRVSDLAWWDLRACWRALPSAESWVPGWAACGCKGLTGSLVDRRMDALISDALVRLESASG